jgi:hypothetical protein
LQGKQNSQNIETLSNIAEELREQNKLQKRIMRVNAAPDIRVASVVSIMSENEAHLKFNNVGQLATITKIEQDEKDVVFLYDISEFPFHLQKNVEIKIEYFGIEEKKFKSVNGILKCIILTYI